MHTYTISIHEHQGIKHYSLLGFMGMELFSTNSAEELLKFLSNMLTGTRL